MNGNEGLSKRVQSAGYLQEVHHLCGVHVRVSFFLSIGGIEPQGNEWIGCQQESSPAQLHEVHPTRAFCQAGLRGF